MCQMWPWSDFFFTHNVVWYNWFQFSSFYWNALIMVNINFLIQCPFLTLQSNSRDLALTFHYPASLYQ